MSTTQSIHFQTARYLAKIMESGKTFAEVTEIVGGKPTAEDMAKMVATFRSDSLRLRFAEWVAA